jgi:hypothetical protein
LRALCDLVNPSTCVHVSVYHQKKVIILLGLYLNSSHYGTFTVIMFRVLRYSISNCLLTAVSFMDSETQIPTPWQARHRSAQATSLQSSVRTTTYLGSFLFHTYHAFSQRTAYFRGVLRCALHRMGLGLSWRPAFMARLEET